MVLVTVLCLFITLSVNYAVFNKYEFYPERSELLYVNNSLFKNVHYRFGKVNRTYLALNASFDIVQDFADQTIFGTIKCFQFFHNEYRFTGTQATVDTCKIQKANTFSLQEQFKSAQFHIDLCNLRKGSYKLVNFAPQSKYFPLYLPLGKTRSNIRLHDGYGSDFFNLNWDFEIRPPKNDD